MKEINSYAYYFENFGDIAKRSICTIPGFSIFSVISFVVTLSGVQKAIIGLVAVFIVDFITGCVASWIEHKADNTPIRVYFFETKKVRMSIAKAISYGVLILFAWLFTALFFDKKLSLVLSSRQFTVVEITIGVCIAIEFWSNLENLKRAGFDVVGQLTSLIQNFWKLNKAFKNESSD